MRIQCGNGDRWLEKNGLAKAVRRERKTIIARPRRQIVLYLMTMHEDGRAIFKFLQRFEAEVIGHQGEPPPIEIREELRQLARGEVSAGPRTALIDLLAARPEWIRFLADEVKSLRTKGGNYG